MKMKIKSVNIVVDESTMSVGTIVEEVLQWMAQPAIDPHTVVRFTYHGAHFRMHYDPDIPFDVQSDSYTDWFFVVKKRHAAEERRGGSYFARMKRGETMTPSGKWARRKTNDQEEKQTSDKRQTR